MGKKQISRPSSSKLVRNEAISASIDSKNKITFNVPRDHNLWKSSDNIKSDIQPKIFSNVCLNKNLTNQNYKKQEEENFNKVLKRDESFHDQVKKMTDTDQYDGNDMDMKQIKEPKG